MTTASALPPGQYETSDFPRFGLGQFAERFPKDSKHIAIALGGDVRASVTVTEELKSIARIEQHSDFHCVTTWTHRSLRWSGVCFADFYRQIVVPLAAPLEEIRWVVIRSQDGYHSIMPLADLLEPDVLLADALNGEPLTIAHGAPIRLVAPAHYGYKSVKHIKRIEFLKNDGDYRPVGLRFMAHPRARVAAEERGRWIPGWLLRYLYRPLVRPTAQRFAEAMHRHLVLRQTQDERIGQEDGK